jgi:hypothetical protein
MKAVAILANAALLLLLGCAPGGAIPPVAHPDTTEWPELFAPDLSNTIGADSVWTLTDGILTASQDQVVWTQRIYDDYVLDLEFMTEEHTNSGVILHGSDIERWTHYSVEIQISNDFDKTSAEPPTMFECGSAFGHLAPTEQRVKPAGEWNRYTITAKDRMIWVMLNGGLVTELDMSLWTSGEKNPDGSDIPEWLSVPLADLPTEGHIGLQGKHGEANIYFRNVKIMELE